MRGFARGLSASYLGVSESTIQWVLYEQFKRLFREGERVGESKIKKILRDALGAGFFAKLIATVVTYPHEVNPQSFPLLTPCPFELLSA